jgi:hypothetical protein
LSGPVRRRAETLVVVSSFVEGISTVLSNHERVGLALEWFAEGVRPVFLQELRGVYPDTWQAVIQASFRFDRGGSMAGPVEERLDAQALLTVMWDQWNAVFRNSLTIFERSLVSELREFRNRWAHQASTTEDDCYRVLDTVERLFIAIGVEAHLEDLRQQKLDLLRQRFGQLYNHEQSRRRFNRRRMYDITIYAVCLSAIWYMAATYLVTTAAVFLTLFVTMAFILIVYGRVQDEVPLYGIHECHRCRKVVYTELCPYCEPAPYPRLDQSTSGELPVFDAVPPRARTRS